MKINKILFVFVLFLILYNINQSRKTIKQSNKHMTAKEILGNPDYLAISYGGYRANSRAIQPTIPELKEDMKILHAMGVKFVRTYNVHFAQTSNLLEAIHQLKKEDDNFEMYVMLGAWIDCKNAFNWSQGEPNHNEESERNPKEIKASVALAKKYSDIVKVIAVGNEAMVKWATSYYVRPGIILKWVNHLQELKKSGELPSDLWITTSDNFASWGGGDASYHVEDLEKLIHAVDYISMHTYPIHDTHYHPVFWGTLENEQELSKIEQIDAAMLRSKEYAVSQYNRVKAYMKSLGINKPIHIGETGWASFSGGHYGNNGSKATDEYKEALYYKHMREWTKAEGMSCFYFEAFDENWKDAQNPNGSENHFGLFTIEGKAKYALWNLVDKDVFKGLSRNGNPISKTYNGNKEALLNEVLIPSVKRELVENN